MARHRMTANAGQPDVVRKSHTDSAVWRLNQRRCATTRQRTIRIERTQMLSVATLTPLVLACAVSGAARPFQVPTTASPLPPVVWVGVVPAAVPHRPGSVVCAVAPLTT